jgi:hypothetical protein
LGRLSSNKQRQQHHQQDSTSATNVQQTLLDNIPPNNKCLHKHEPVEKTPNSVPALCHLPLSTVSIAGEQQRSPHLLYASSSLCEMHVFKNAAQEMVCHLQ